MKELLIISAPATSRSGYGDHSRDLIRSLIAMDRFDIQILDQRWGNCDRNALTDADTDITSRIMITQPNRQPDVWIQVTVPNEFQKVGKFNIGITAGMESDLVSKEWVDGCNRMDLVITTSEHSKQSFTNSVYQAIDNRTQQSVGEVKVDKPIEVLFEGLDTETFYKTDEIDVTIKEALDGVKEKFCYLIFGHWLQGDLTHDRKDIGGTLGTIIETFRKSSKKNRPGIILKTSGATFSVTDRETILSRLNQVFANYKKSELPNIYLLHGDLTQSEVNSLYNHPKVKAMVSFTHGEGFGRPLLEFSVTGKPILASNWSGHVDFLKHSIKLAGELKPIHPSSVQGDMIIKESKWFYVNYGYASKLLKQVYTNYKDYVSDARKQARVSREEFNKVKMTEKFTEILDKYIVKQVPLQLPKLKKVEKKTEIKLPKLKKVTNEQ